MANKFLIILLIIALAGFVTLGFFYWQIRVELLSQTQEVEDLLKQIDTLEKKIDELKTKTPTDETTNWKTYRSEEYGYEFKYSWGYFLKEVSSDYILLRKMGGKETDWLINLSIKKDIIDQTYDTSKMSFEEFAIERIKAGCAADGPGGSIYCTEVSKQKSLIIENGIEGYEIYITEVFRRPDGKISERIKGPIFVFDISQQTDNLARGLFLELTELGEKQIDEDTLRNITKSVTF